MKVSFAISGGCLPALEHAGNRGKQAITTARINAVSADTWPLTALM